LFLESPSSEESWRVVQYDANRVSSRLREWVRNAAARLKQPEKCPHVRLVQVWTTRKI
jgi:hypothetical protein